jgi:predicted nucleic acid-binding protein
LFYNRRKEGSEIDVVRTVSNLLEVVPVVPPVHEEAILAAAAFVDEHGSTPFDALHAGIVAASDERILTSERDDDEVGVERVPLAADE